MDLRYTDAEAALVIDASRDSVASRRFDELINVAQITIEPITEGQARIARDAYKDFGKGSRGFSKGMTIGHTDVDRAS